MARNWSSCLPLAVRSDTICSELMTGTAHGSRSVSVMVTSNCEVLAV
ncbi:Uncharacterised protein [Mycobacteroides abscessus subsp. abscessus]|nr:Uncharacterised protein [Mycobacteroides abscessus subsp. abscessus]